jgi:hypothetical protein
MLARSDRARAHAAYTHATVVACTVRTGNADGGRTGPESRSARADRSGPFDAKALADRAWLAALPDEIAAQRRAMAGLAGRCEAWPLVTSLLVGCSLGRGAGDALSDIDAAPGVDTPRGAAGAERIRAVEAMVAATQPELGALVDVLRHRAGPAGQWVRRIFAQYADGTQLDLAVVAEAQIEAPPRRRRPDFILLYKAAAPPGSQKPDAPMPTDGSAPSGEL